MTNHPIEPHPAVARAAKAVHEHLCRRNIMQYLANDEDCEGVARAVLETLRDLPEDVIVAGADALEGVQCAMLDRARSDKPEDMPDYDGGDMVAQPFTAMINTILGEE